MTITYLSYYLTIILHNFSSDFKATQRLIQENFKDIQLTASRTMKLNSHVYFRTSSRLLHFGIGGPAKGGQVFDGVGIGTSFATKSRGVSKKQNILDRSILVNRKFLTGAVLVNKILLTRAVLANVELRNY